VFHSQEGGKRRDCWLVLPTTCEFVGRLRSLLVSSSISNASAETAHAIFIVWAQGNGPLCCSYGLSFRFYA